MSKSLLSDLPTPQAGGSGAPAGVWRREIWETLCLSAPLAFTQLAMIGINTTDIVMMGWLGPEYLAAGALGMNIYIPLFLFGLGIATVVAPMAAQALGGRDFRGVRRTVRQGFWLTLVFAVVFSLVVWNGRWVMLLFGQEADVALRADDYLKAVTWALLPSLWFVVLRCFVTAHSRPRSALVITLIAVAVNALGNYGLMFGNFGLPRWELLGAGVTSSVVSWLMFFALLGFVLWDRRFKRYAILLRFWRPDWPRFRELFRLGLPIGLTLLAETGLFSGAAFLMGLISTEALAAHAIALQCAAVAFMVPMGISQAAVVRVGLAAGSRDPAAVGRAGWASLLVGTLFMTASALVFWFAGRQLVGLFLDLNVAANEPVIRLAVSFLVIAALFQLVDGAQVIGVSALRGLKDTKVPMWLALTGYWGVGFTTSAVLAFPLGLGGQGVWIGLAVGLFFVAVAAVWRFYRRAVLLPNGGLAVA
ncbi:MATE family efflux transporter [Pelagibius litoralis]|uniref:MATE family efflux transporter n=1 Tax=Pelagibius litoralis TaxID=374515 RepID=A0A967EZ65_9PROT|nr:MATE family efflux transporter [Pelagibius litoralis]NIA70132.1 MATE family efflux transporter [Pelagibius litoralis]